MAISEYIETSALVYLERSRKAQTSFILLKKQKGGDHPPFQILN